jgi:hypothetical protein
MLDFKTAEIVGSDVTPAVAAVSRLLSLPLDGLRSMVIRLP